MRFGRDPGEKVVWEGFPRDQDFSLCPLVAFPGVWGVPVGNSEFFSREHFFVVFLASAANWTR